MARTSTTPKKLPDPGAVALLGDVLELQVKGRDGQTRLHSWEPGSAPGLLWSPSLRALLFFPKKRLGPFRRESGVERNARLDMREGVKRLGLPKTTTEAGRLFAKWAARPATGYAQVQIEPYPLKPAGSGVHIVYRSDKWNPGRTQDYIHHFSKAGTVKVSEAAGSPPKAFFINGGRLTVNERGIIY